MEYKKPLTCAITAVVILFLAGFAFLAACAFDRRQKSPQMYKQGLDYYAQGDYRNAYYNFSRIYPGLNLYPNALYYQAKCADALGDKKTAQKKYSRLAGLIKDENVTPFLLWRLGQLGDGDKFAKRSFLKLKNLYGSSEYGIATNYELSKLVVEPNQKRDCLLEYIKYSPNGRYIKDVLLTLLSNDYKLDGAQKIIFAKALYENGAYRRAISVLKDVPIELSWPLLLKLLDKVNSGQNVLKIGQKGFSLDNSHFDEDTLRDAVLIYAKYAPEGEYFALENIYKTASDRRIKGVALQKIPDYLSKEYALKYKAKFFENFKDSKFAADALWDIFISAIEANKNPLALKYGKAYLSLYRDVQTPAVLYFVACLKKKMADSSYKKQVNMLLEKYPGSYYTFLAYKNLINKNFLASMNTKISSQAHIEFPYKKDKAFIQFFENFAGTEDYAPFEDFRINDLLIRSWIEHKKGNRALSSVLARDYIKQSDVMPPRDNPAWKLAYPIYYADEINKWAEKRGLSPYLILALIKEESHFNPKTRSLAGAAGLMQVMPSTAEMIAQKTYTGGELADPELNIKLGTKYFADLMEIFSNNEPLCVLSYNAGPNVVKRWLEDKASMPFDVMAETIPYAETRSYIKKVYGAYWNYLLTWGKIKL